MDTNDLSLLLSKEEGHTLEFKKSTSQLKAALETICAFLNEQGGTVLIGIMDNGKVVGQDVTDQTRQEIANEINKLEPSAIHQVSVKYIALNGGKYVIALQTKNGDHPPYVYDGRAFQRNQSTTVRMGQHRYEQLLIQRGNLNHSWDELTASDYEITQLDFDEINLMVNQGIKENRISSAASHESPEEVLKRLKLINKGALTNAAVVLFAKDVRPDYPQCHVKMARFRGIDKTGDFIDNQSYYGNVFSILAQTTAFINRHLPISSYYQPDSLKRVDEPTLPPIAVRESIINAVCHRDYANKSTSISIAIYDDRLEIWNYGSLPARLTIEDLKRNHESFPRNRLIADVLYLSGFIEKWGTGTTKMIAMCEQANIPSPEFKENSGGLSVIFKFREPIVTTISPTIIFTSRQLEIIKILQSGEEFNRQAILAKMKTSVSERTFRNDIRILEKSKVIKSKGHTNNRVWFIINKDSL